MSPFCNSQMQVSGAFCYDVRDEDLYFFRNTKCFVKKLEFRGIDIERLTLDRYQSWFLGTLMPFFTCR